MIKTNREIVLEVIEAIGGHRSFWDEAPTCQEALAAAEKVVAEAFAERIDGKARTQMVFPIIEE
jgi:hypothetical protein